MPIFKVQRDSDKKYLSKRYWRDVSKIWEDDGHIFSTIQDLRLVQNRICGLMSSPTTYSGFDRFHIVMYDLELMQKSNILLNRVSIDNLMIGDRLHLSFCHFLPLTQMKRLLKSGFVPGQSYDIRAKYKGYVSAYGGVLKGVNYGYDHIEFVGYPGMKLPYCLFSQF